MAMATTMVAMMTPCSHQHGRDSNIIVLRSLPQCKQISHGAADTKFGYAARHNVCQRGALLISSLMVLGHQSPLALKPCRGSLVKPVSAVGSGLQASITDPEANAIHIKNARIVVESQEDTLMQVRVDLTGEDTRIVFDKVLINLGRTAPPVPGFRRQKGGKSSKVPKDFLLQILGEERVTKFVIQEIVSSTLADYAKKENLTVKDNKINTIQTAEELRSSFVPGNEFGFNAKLELEKVTTETSS